MSDSAPKNSEMTSPISDRHLEIVNAELQRRNEKLLSLVSHLSESEIQHRFRIIELQLSDYDFLTENEDSEQLSPSDVINSYLKSTFPAIPDDKARSEWFAVLALYFFNLMTQKSESRTRFLNFFNHSHNLATDYENKANRIINKIKQLRKIKNSEINKNLNKKKYIRNSRLKNYAFAKYTIAYEELEKEEKRVTYDAIISKILLDIEEHNIHPKTKERVIGKGKGHKDPGDPGGTLKKWFRQGVKEKVLQSPRQK